MTKKTKKSNAGRPTVITPKIIEKLEEAFIDGMSDEEACILAGITTTPFYNYQKENPEFKERKDRLKQALGIKAKATLAKAIFKGDKETTKWWLSRKKKDEFSTRSELTGDNGNPIEHADVTRDDEEILERYYQRYHKKGDQNE